MITRFSQVACPECGHFAKPVTKQPGSENVSSVLAITGALGTAYDAYRLTGAELFCAQCGHQFTTSLQSKGKDLFGRARQFAERAAAEIQAPVCGACHSRLANPPPNFCGQCGARITPALKEIPPCENS